MSGRAGVGGVWGGGKVGRGEIVSKGGGVGVVGEWGLKEVRELRKVGEVWEVG